MSSCLGHLEGGVQTDSLAPPPGYDLIGPRWDLRICSADEFSGEAAAGPGTTLWGSVDRKAPASTDQGDSAPAPWPPRFSRQAAQDNPPCPDCCAPSGCALLLSLSDTHGLFLSCLKSQQLMNGSCRKKMGGFQSLL